MTEIFLGRIKDALMAVCPFEVRLAHCENTFCGRNCIYIEENGISCEKIQNESAGTRYSVDACVSVTAAVPVKSEASDLSRIAAAYILPVMTGLGFCITGFSKSGVQDSIARGVHTIKLQFRIKGIYTIPAQEVL